MPRSARRPALATFLLLAATLGASLVAPTADAASVSLVGSTVVRWKNNPVPYVLHPACSGDLATAACLDEVRKSFATWVGPACSYLQFNDAGFSSNLKLTSVGYNENGKNEFAWIENSAWTYGKYVLGVTSPLYYTTGKDTGVIIEADIAMNGYLQTWSMSGKNYTTDVMNVAVHEIGHFFGLQHNLYPNKNQPETMAPTADPFMGSRTPEQDDLDGLCFLYPKSGAYACQTNANCPKVVDDGPSGEIYVGQIPCQNSVCAGAPTSVPTGGGKLGDGCTSDSNCDAPTFCQPISSSSAVCSQNCNPQQSGSCPGGFGCVAYQGSTTQGACIAGAGGGGGGGGGTKNVGETCNSSAECKTQLCVQSGGKTTCEVPCTASAQCPSGQTCQLFSGKTYGACAVPPSGGGTDKLPDGAGCTASSQCSSGLCVGSGNSGTCIADCTSQACPSGYACMTLTNGKGGCFKTGDGKLGESCSKDLDCQSGVCEAADNKYICSQTCTSSANCPTGYACYDVGGGGACLPAAQKKGVGDACQSSGDCVTGLCVGGDSGATCTQPCTTDAQCGAGSACAPLQGGGGACITLGSKQPGQACDSAYDCSTAECVDFGKGYVCGAPCNGDVDCACGQQCTDYGKDSWCAAGKKVACVPDFEACTESSECVGGLCLGGKCAPACSIFGAGATCGDDKGCVRLEADKPEGVCSSKGPEGFGSACNGDTGCVSLFCHQGTCGKPCNPFGPNTCPLGLVCNGIGGSVGACGAAPQTGGDDAGGGGGGGVDAGGTEADSGGDSGGGADTGNGAGATDTGVNGGTGGGTAQPGGTAGGASPSGCTATATAPRSNAAAVVLLLAMMALVTRRRRLSVR